MFKEGEADMKKDIHDLLKFLPDAECRYVAFEHVYKSADGRPSDQIYFIR